MPITGASEKLPGLFFDKGGAVYNVLHPDYNARRDGVLDDTAAIQSALTDAGQGGEVTLPGAALSYRVMGQLTVPAGCTMRLGQATLLVSHPNPIILGADANLIGGTIQWSVTTAISAVTPGDRSQIVFTRFIGSGTTGTAGAPLYQRGVYSGTGAGIGSNVVVMRCRFENMTVAVWAGGSSLDPVPVGWKITHSHFENIVGYKGQSEGYAILFAPASNGLIAHNTYKNITRHAVYLSGGASNNRVAFNDIDTVDNIAIQLNTASTQPASANNKIVWNTIRNLTKSIAYGYRSSIGIGSYGNNPDTEIAFNTVDGYQDNGIDSGNSIFSGVAYNLRTTIRGNHVRNGAATQDACIRIDDPDDALLEGNRCSIPNNTYGIIATSTQAPAIASAFAANRLRGLGVGAQGLRFILTTATTGTHRASGNELIGMTGPINDSNNNVALLDNPGYNPVGPSTVTVTASPMTYTAGASPETLSVKGGTVSSITKSGVTLATVTNQQIRLAPWQSVIITYSSAPTLAKDVH